HHRGAGQPRRPGAAAGVRRAAQPGRHRRAARRAAPRGQQGGRRPAGRDAGGGGLCAGGDRHLRPRRGERPFAPRGDAALAGRHAARLGRALQLGRGRPAGRGGRRRLELRRLGLGGGGELERQRRPPAGPDRLRQLRRLEPHAPAAHARVGTTVTIRPKKWPAGARGMTMIGAMSGHNRWSKIKHKKEASDSKKSKMWTKLIKELTVSARVGGGDINGNPRLRTAVEKARLQNMPNDTIDRAIKKGTGDLEGVTYEEFNYEVFGPGGIAVLVEIMTDNRNRTAGEVRSVITRHGGNLGASGSVAYMFKKQGLVVYEAAAVNEDKVTELAIELGADDVKTEGESLIVVTDPKSFESVRE